ncbi:MAG: CoA transferase [Gemmatimonadetes bacterium]|nr:CoA transferase [Gemmatimonadota bacterium]
MTPPAAHVPDTAPALPLAGLRVLDLSRLVAGNMLTLSLADFGADVIKVEEPGTGDALREWTAGGQPLFWKVYARNKRSITLNLRSAEARALLLKLVPTADVFVESFKFGTLEKLGLGPDVLLAANPRLVIVRISGFGQTGPYSARPGFGTLIEAMSGLAAKTGFPHHPPVLPNVALADMVAGLSGAFSVMAALRARDVHGQGGQVIDLSLLEPLLSIVGPDAAIYQHTGEIPLRIGNRLSVSAPRNVYHTKDGHYLAISASMQPMCEKLFTVMGRADMITDPRFANNAARIENIDELDAIIQEFVGQRTLDENTALFQGAGITAGPVYDTAQLVDDPHVRAREVLVEYPDADIGSVKMHNVTPRLSGTPGDIRKGAPNLGEDNRAVFGEVGVTAAELARLHADGTV